MIRKLPPDCATDARDCAKANDLAGLAYIINMAHGRAGHSTLKLGYVMDVADMYRGGMNNVTGRHPASSRDYGVPL
jgi:hypothetical protein